MKSFTVTKEMRNNIAQRLTAKAVAAEMKAINTEAEAINKAALLEDRELITRIKAVCLRQQELITTILNFHRKTMMGLNACRTAKQMRELFPEGAKLLPKPIERTTDLAPKELAESVTKMIQQGVPPVQ